jgi:hypothetical protein
VTYGRSRVAELLLGVAALCLVPGRSAAAPGTCTVVGDGIFLRAFVPSAGGRIDSPPDPPGSVDGLQLPVDVDAATGRFSMLRATLPDVALGTQAGDVILHMAGPDVIGTLDAAGNAVLPNFSFDQILGTIMLPIAPTMTTGIASQDIPGNVFVDHGTPLDFTTGILTLVGPAVIPDAPIVHEPVISEVRVRCRLDPKPDAASLPAAPSAKVNGKAVITGGDQGDSLKLKAKLTPGATPFGFSGGDVYVRIAGTDDSDVVVTRVLAGMLKAKGKKFSAKDKDGSVIGVLVGKRPSPAPAGGSLTATNGKKKATLGLHLVGLDLGALGTSAQVTVQVGTNVATAGVTVSGSGKKRTLR